MEQLKLNDMLSRINNNTNYRPIVFISSIQNAQPQNQFICLVYNVYQHK